ncbi:hypothetical protein DYB25_000377 [Aphanomyces astaci]|uniref:ABC transporter domain-containing protein n=1 Tax=Aphanomyces astaci TaxID=112090 RepID=A0A396ZWS6_APHAT|nr:hypothetical protein DYB25_000377 [Aphanomyces astaci]RHY18302.1 hypothetical protein DYB36_002267 [Aphanomyces astaci]RHY74986.1 hypothetical protein DYB34_000903 [Aphanomyces astaci]RHZ40735.1 hypothetical protein DYB26_001301 [Aphanomyces astaci]
MAIDAAFLDVSADSAPLHPCTLSWDNLNFKVTAGKVNKRILRDISGRSAPGQVTAILGPSGSGKTTLLDILADRVSSGKISGDIDVNGKPRDKHFRLLASYVAQEDSLLGSFTVLETLRYAAKLSVASTVSAMECESRVQQAISDMGLRSCEDTIVGDIFRKGLSGGQKRRLSIAIELLSHPTILLLDEPTSGLDSASTFALVQYIAKLAKQNRTIVCTIHQPSSVVFNLFDNVMILSQGRTAYFGSPQLSIAHFANLGHPCPPFTNPGEFFLQLVNTDFDGHEHPAVIAKGFAASDMHKILRAAIQKDRESLGSLAFPKAIFSMDLRPSALDQLKMLLHRNSVNNVRNPGVYGVRLVMYIMLSLMVGSVYVDNTSVQDLTALLFYVQAFLVFMSVAVLPFFIEQRVVFNRERANNSLSVGSYVVANFLAALPGILVIAVVSSAIVVGLAGLNSFGYFVLNLFLSLVVAESLMHVLGATAPHYIIGIALGAGVFGMFMLVEGFMVPYQSIPAGWRWVHYVAFHSYSFKAFMFKQFKPMNTTASRAILKRFDVEDVNVDGYMLVLVAYALVLQALFTFILWKWHTGRR